MLNRTPPRSLRVLNSRLDRRCGTCQACCVAGHVPETNKPAGQACPQMRVGKPGCTVHGEANGQPPSCASFRCLWLQGVGPDAYRPDRVGVFLSLHEVETAPEHPGFAGIVGASMRGEKVGIIAVECWKNAARTSAKHVIDELRKTAGVGVVPYPSFVAHDDGIMSTTQGAASE